jgi:hypothetical protein
VQTSFPVVPLQPMQPSVFMPSASIAGVLPGVATLTAPAAVGTSTLQVSSAFGFEMGQEVIIDAGTAKQEVSAIQGIGPLTLTYPLKYDHAVGASVKVASAALAPMQAAPYQTFGSMAIAPAAPSVYGMPTTVGSYLPPLGSTYGQVPAPEAPMGRSETPFEMGVLKTGLDSGDIPVPAFWLEQNSLARPTKKTKSRYFLIEHLSWGNVVGRIYLDEEKVWQQFKQTTKENEDKGMGEKPVLLTNENFAEIARAGIRDAQVDADIRCYWVQAIGNPSEGYRNQPPNLPYYHVDHHGIWYDKIICAIWPHGCNFVGDMIKKKASDVFLEKFHQPLSPALSEGVDNMVNNLKTNPLRVPITSTWLQSVLEEFWLVFKPAVNKVLPDVVWPFIQSKLPGIIARQFRLDPCTLGATTPQIKSMTADVVERQTGARDGGEMLTKQSLYLLIDLEYKSDLDIEVKGPLHLHLGVKSIYFKAKLHVCLMDLVDHIPFFTGIRAYFYDPFHLYFDWVGALDFLDCDTLEKEIHEKINNAAGQVLFFPNMISKVIDKHAEADIAMDVISPRPVGILRIRVIRGAGLRCDDFNFSTLWNGKRSSDAFVQLRIGGDVYETSVQTATQDGIRGGRAEWDEEDYYFLIYDVVYQTLDVDMIDKDKVGDDPLARHPLAFLISNIFDLRLLWDVASA